MKPAPVSRNTARSRLSRRFGARVTSIGAVIAAVAALTLSACGPHDESVAGPYASGGATATAVQPRQGQPVPAVPTSLPSPSPAAAPAPAFAPPPPLVVARAEPVPLVTERQAEAAGDATPGPEPRARYASPPQPVAHGRTGRIESIEPIRTRPQGSGAGAVIGGVLGAVVGNQFGHGGGRAVMTGAGAIGGALAGNNVERNYKEGVSGYRVSIRLDNGSSRTFTRTQAGNLQVGDRVRVDANAFRRL